MKSLLLIAPVALSLSGCFASKDELGSLKREMSELKTEQARIVSNLGDFQYEGIDPLLSATLRNVVFDPIGGVADNPSVSFTINIKQNNDELTLSLYGIQLAIDVTDNEDNYVDDFAVNAVVENGVGSIAATKTFYGKRYIDETHKLSIVSYHWWPNSELKIINTK